MKLSSKIYEYEIKGQEYENNLINEKINYTTRNYFYLINNFSKQISQMEEEINIYRQNCPIKINELIYNQHMIIKELISIINKKQKINLKNNSNSNNESTTIEFINNNEIQHIISFNILSKNKFNININMNEPIPLYKKIITPASHKYTINTPKAQNEVSKSLDKKNINSLSTYDYSLKSQKKYKNIYFTPMTEKIKRERQFKRYNLKKSFNNLKNKYYKPSFLNSFVVGKNNRKNETAKYDLASNGYICTCGKVRNRNRRNITIFNGSNSYESFRKGTKRVKSSSKNIKMNRTFYNLRLVDDFIVNNLINRSTSRPNKYVRNLYLVSNEIVDKYQKKYFDY